MKKYSILLLLLSTLNVSMSLKIIGEDASQIYLTPETKTFNNTSLVNKGKEKWLIEHKLSTYSSSLKNNLTEINLLLLAQQKSMVRPRNLSLFLKYDKNDAKRKGLLRIEYYYDTSKIVNPILLNNSMKYLINLDKKTDLNYENDLDNRVTSMIQRKLYKKLKEKIQLKILFIYKDSYTKIIKEYNVKIYLTTDEDHFNYLNWSPSLV